jgi:CHAT domain-containing protein
MRIAWSTHSPEDAIATGKQALDAIERLRDRQPGLESRAAAFSAWTQDYYWLSNQILRLATDPAHAAQAQSLINEAFQIAERMRARSLLDRLRAPETALVDVDAASLQRRDSLSKSIVAVNRELLQLKSGDRTALRDKLAELEREEADAREAQANARASEEVVTVADVQQRIAKNEALLSFQIAGKSWLSVITRDQARVIELPDRKSLTQSLALFKGLVRQPEHRERARAALFDRLLKDAIDGLPPGIDRLLVVPDLPLDTFPISALTARYEIAVVPSATIWHGWRTHPTTPNSRSVLVLADPQLTLPYARDEGREIIDRLQGRGTLLIGGRASEAAFKATDLSRYGVVHFAAHAAVDSVNTERSAILLASGTNQQDGLLQSREIADLRLDGQLVVLSSCQSATGTDVRGEGVMGLARSFFAAGSRTVIGSLWPVRDDHAAAFFEPFYAALSEGQSVGAAFHSAQRRLIDEGLPMEAWAGFVLMGDADAVPVAGIETVGSRAGWWIAIAAAICIACFIPLVRRRYATQRAARRPAGLRPARTVDRPPSHSPALSLE